MDKYFKYKYDAEAAKKLEMYEAKAQGIQEGKAKGIEEGITQGIQEGKIQGIQEGLLEAKRNIIKNMLNNNFDIETISKVTELSITEVESIIKSIQE